MPSLSDILPEPEDGATVVLEVGNEMRVVVRSDLGATIRNKGPRDDEARWFYLDEHEFPHPRTWVDVARSATRAYALGPLLADLEADRG